jgi:hypothetical protein
MEFNETDEGIEGTLVIRADNRPDTALIRFGIELFAKIKEDLPIGTLLSFRYDKQTKEICLKPYKYKEK